MASFRPLQKAAGDDFLPFSRYFLAFLCIASCLVLSLRFQVLQSLSTVVTNVLILRPLGHLWVSPDLHSIKSEFQGTWLHGY